MVCHFRKIDKSTLGVNKVVDNGSNSNDFNHLCDIIDTNIAFNIVNKKNLNRVGPS